MAEKFILHVGFHKTGTTAIQTSLHHQRDSLLEHGITYHYNRARAEHEAAWGLNAKVWGWKNRGGKETPISKWNRFAKKVNKTKGTVVASSEFFSELNLEKIKKIRDDITTDQVQIVFTIRPLAKMLASSYQQYLKYGIKATYEQWLHAMLDEPGKSKQTPSFWQRNFHGQSIQNWADVFGTQNVIVMVVDEKNPQALYSQFNDYLGLPEGRLVEQASGGNRSLTASEVELLQLINLKYPKDRAWDDYTIFVRQTAIKALTDKKAPEGSEKLQTPQWAIDLAAKLTAESIEQIKSSGVRVIGDLDTLSSTKVPSGENPKIGLIDVESVADMILALDQKIIRKMRWKTVLVEVLRRIKARLKGN
ncbi:MAG: hypothetical protein RLY34_15 [Actinomycetota bacterium]|jgi:hypothetical protein